MKCTCCNATLTDYEATLKHDETGEFLDTCTECLADILMDVALPIKGNKELLLRKDNSTQESLDSEQPEVD